MPVNTKHAPFVDRGEATFTYKVEQVLRNSIHGGKTVCHVVVQYKDGEVVGGDHSWLNLRTALWAKDLYEERPDFHGKPSNFIIEEIAKRF